MTISVEIYIVDITLLTMQEITPTPEDKYTAEFGPKCSNTPEPVTPLPLAEGEPQGPCDTPVVRDPDVFVSPPGAVNTDPTGVSIPDPLLVYNTEVIKTCEADSPETGNIGDPGEVTISAGSLSERVYFQELDLSVSELRRLSTIEDLQRLVDEYMTPDEVKAFTNLSSTDTTALLGVISSTRDTLQQTANNLALGQLNCVFGNERIYISCDPALQGTYSSNLITSEYPVITIEENTVTSTVSRVAANEVATDARYEQLDCMYGNDEQVVTCDASQLEAHNGRYFLTREFITSNPLLDLRADDATGILEVGRKLVSKVVIPADTLTDISKDVANQRATALGSQQLDCFFPSAEVTKYCYDESSVVSGWAQDEGLNRSDTQTALGGEGIEIYNIDEHDGRGKLNEIQGKSIHVPEGYFISDVSQDQANSLASNQARSLLLCFWTNKEASCSCAEGYDTDLTSIPNSIVQPGSVRDFGGPVTDADLTVLCEAQLACTYCNADILPSCLPTGYLEKVEAYDGDRLILPVVPSLYSDEDLDWSLDATSGVAAKTFCFPDKPTVDSLALAASSIPARPITGEDSAGCRYANERQIVGCVEGNDLDAHKFTTSEGVGLSPDSSSSQVIAAGVIIVTDKETDKVNLDGGTNYTPTQYANLLAQNLGISFLLCFFVNRSMNMNCFDDANNATSNDLPAPSITSLNGDEVVNYGDGKMLSEGGRRFPVWEEAPGSTSNGINIQKGTFISYTSRAEAEVFASNLALSVMDCYFANPSINTYCGARVESLGDSNTFETSASQVSPSVTLVTVGDGKIGNGSSGGFKFNSSSPVSTTGNTSLSVLGNYTSGRPEDAPAGSPIRITLGGGNAVNPAGGGGTGVYRDIAHLDSNGSASKVVVVDRGLFISRVSYFDTVSQALSSGIGRLSCFVKNDSTSTSCIRHAPWLEENPDPDLPPILRTEDIFYSESVTDVSLDPNVITSTQSKFEANTQAWAMIFGLLVCQYENYVQIKNCIWDDELQDTHGPTPNWWKDEPATVAAGLITSSKSSQDAGAIALRLARSEAVCLEYPLGSGLGGASCGWIPEGFGDEDNPRDIILRPSYVYLESALSRGPIKVMPTFDIHPDDNDFGFPLDRNTRPKLTVENGKKYNVFMFFRRGLGSLEPYARMVVLEDTLAPEDYYKHRLEKFVNTGVIEAADDEVTSQGDLCGPVALDVSDDTACRVLTIMDARPAYAEHVVEGVTTGNRFWVYTGLVNGVEADNYLASFDLPVGRHEFYIECNLNNSGLTSSLQVLSTEIKVAVEGGTPINNAWRLGEARPPAYIIRLGTVDVTEKDSYSITNRGCGGFELTEHIVFLASGGPNQTRFTKQISLIRLNG